MFFGFCNLKDSIMIDLVILKNTEQIAMYVPLKELANISLNFLFTRIFSRITKSQQVKRKDIDDGKNGTNHLAPTQIFVWHLVKLVIYLIRCLSFRFCNIFDKIFAIYLIRCLAFGRIFKVCDIFAKIRGNYRYPIVNSPKAPI